MATILLTGGAGMVGRNIVDVLRTAGNTVFAPTRSEMNLTDYSQTLDFLSANDCDFVIHAAGLVGGIQANLKRPFDFCLENTLMGLNLVRACDALEIQNLLNLGSSCMYPRGRSRPLRETDILTGELEPTNEGYALSKITIARLCQYLSSQKENRFYKTLIPCNLYGPYDSFNENKSHLIPAIIVKMHNALKQGDSTVEIWGDGTARREFMYVNDLAELILMVTKRFKSVPSIMNAGLGFDYSVNEYYEITRDVVGCEVEFIHDISKPVGMERKLVDTTLATSWGWSSSTPLVDGIEQTYSFYKKEILNV